MELQCESTLGGGRRYTGQIWTQGSVFWKGATLRSRLTCSLIMRADLGLYHALSLIVAPPANWWHSDPFIALSQPKGPGARPHGVQMAWRKVRLPRVMSVCVCVWASEWAIWNVPIRETVTPWKCLWANRFQTVCSLLFLSYYTRKDEIILIASWLQQKKKKNKGIPSECFE